MTDYAHLSSRKTAEAKLKEAKGFDPFILEAFAGEALALSDALPSRRHITLLGRLVLTAASDWAQKARVDLADTASLLKALSHLSISTARTRQTLRAFSYLASIASCPASARGALRNAAYEIGSDGHALTREACARIHLARHYEQASGELTDLLARLFKALASCGPAYPLWENRTPLLFCDASLTSHRRVAREMARLEPGGLALVSPPLSEKAQRDFAIDAFLKTLTVLVDGGNLLSHVLAPGLPAIFLAERRLAGWTVTYPLGGADPKERFNRRIPAWARALAFADTSRDASEKDVP